MSSFLPDLRFLQAEKRKKASCDRPRTQYHTEIMFDTWNQKNPLKLLESLSVHESGLFFLLLIIQVANKKSGTLITERCEKLTTVKSSDKGFSLHCG